ncbi:hypothetical protein N665_0085s0027 [Sinapis alba]|nr:hypothetical protein N665_0085s0027 [Sinapis alba]
MSPVFNPDGSLKGVYDLQGNYLPHKSKATRGPRNSGQNNVPFARFNMSVLGASPTLVNATSSRAPPSSTGNMAGRGSMSRALSSGRRIPRQAPRLNNRSGSTEQNRMRSGGLGPPVVFPMPGSSYSTAGGRSQNQVPAMNSSMTGGPPSVGSTPVNATMGYDQPLQHHQNTSQYRGQQLSAIGQPSRDVRSPNPTQAATESAPDPYSMLGLLSVINKTDPHVTTLALGLDLTTMGLDMTSKEDLFKTFASPWANEPLKDDPNEFTLPECYNAIQRPPPHQGMFRRFELETLFYIFYSMPKDEAQLYAADELYNRDWFYHKELKCWFLRIGEPLVKTDEYERGTYDCFDPEKFESVQQENMYIFYELLEKRPSLPQHQM